MLDSISNWLKSEGVGSFRLNKFRGKVTSMNRCDCTKVKNTAELMACLHAQLNDDFTCISVKRAKVGYILNVEKTVTL